MPAHQAVTHYFSGQGVIMLADRDASGNPTGFITVGNVSDLKLSFDQTKFEHKESMTGLRGVDLTIPQETNVSMSMTMESIAQESLELALWGTTSDVAAGTGTSGTLSGVKLGRIYDLGALSLTNVVITGTGGTPTYEVDKNYRLNEDAGSIYIMTDAEQTAAGAASNIADASDLEYSYDNATFKQTEALTTAQPVKWARFEGLNTAEGNNPVIVDIFKYQTAPLAELALINDEITQMEVSGNPLSDSFRLTGSKYFRFRTLV